MMNLVMAGILLLLQMVIWHLLEKGLLHILHKCPQEHIRDLMLYN